MGGGRGKSYGTGSPITFKCPKCRARRDRVMLTGRQRPTRARRKNYGRQTDTRREYRCVCGHVGWSTHCDLQQLVLL